MSAGETCAIQPLEGPRPLAGAADFALQDELRSQLFLPASRYVLVSQPAMLCPATISLSCSPEAMDCCEQGPIATIVLRVTVDRSAPQARCSSNGGGLWTYCGPFSRSAS